MKKKKRAKMTWARLNLLCEALRRITRFHDDDPGGAWYGLGYWTDYKPVLTAKWMKPVKKLTPHKLMWFILTPKGKEIVDRLIEAGLTYKHIEAMPADPVVRSRTEKLVVGYGVYTDIRQLFQNPTRLLAQRVFKSEPTLPALDEDALKEIAPGRGRPTSKK